MNKVRRIVHIKLRTFHFQIKTYNMPDTNYPRDNQSQTDNPFPSVCTAILAVPSKAVLSARALVVSFNQYADVTYSNCPQIAKLLQQPVLPPLSA